MEEKSHIFIKRDVLQTLPCISHPMTPIMFAESGSIPSSKGKPKKSIIVVNMAGVYCFRAIKLTGIMKISLFVSVYNIAEIINSGKKRRDIVTKSRQVFIQCDHVDLAIEDLITYHAMLMFNLTGVVPIKFTGFDRPPKPNRDVSRPLVYLAAIRYICTCSKVGSPANQTIVEFFKTTDMRFSKLIYMDETLEPPLNMKQLIYSIIQLGKMITFHFDGFAPFVVCRYAHHFLKHAERVRTIVFENYHDFVPAQLKLEKTNNKAPLTFVFKSCKFEDEVFESLLKEFYEFDTGEIQRLSFVHCKFSLDQLGSLFECLANARCMKTLEIFEIDEFEDSDLIREGIQKISRNCSFLQSISFSNYDPPMCFELDWFNKYQRLTELMLTNQDLTKVFDEEVLLPPLVHYLDFSGSEFSAESLLSLFKVIIKSESPVSLNLSYINLQFLITGFSLPDSHWTLFYESLKTLSDQPFLGIRELDWSGNKIKKEYLKDFADFFMKEGQLKFLSIDRMFDIENFELLKGLLELVPEGSLWGLSIEGSKSRNFKGEIKQLFSLISEIKSLRILYLDGQRLTGGDAKDFFEFIRTNPNIEEISIDNAAIKNEKNFYDFYEELDFPSIKAIGRPIIDLTRFYGSKFDEMSPKSKRNFDSLKERLNQIGDCIQPQVRAFYLCKVELSNEFDYSKLMEFSNTYPRCYFTTDSFDCWIFNEVQRAARYKSALCYYNKSKTAKLSQLHELFLQDPFSDKPAFEIDETTDEQLLNTSSSLFTATPPPPSGVRRKMTMQPHSIAFSTSQLDSNQESNEPMNSHFSLPNDFILSNSQNDLSDIDEPFIHTSNNEEESTNEDYSNKFTSSSNQEENKEETIKEIEKEPVSLNVEKQIIQDEPHEEQAIPLYKEEIQAPKAVELSLDIDFGQNKKDPLDEENQKLKKENEEMAEKLRLLLAENERLVNTNNSPVQKQNNQEITDKMHLLEDEITKLKKENEESILKQQELTERLKIIEEENKRLKESSSTTQSLDDQELSKKVTSLEKEIKDIKAKSKKTKKMNQKLAYKLFLFNEEKAKTKKKKVESSSSSE